MRRTKKDTNAANRTFFSFTDVNLHVVSFTSFFEYEDSRKGAHAKAMTLSTYAISKMFASKGSLDTARNQSSSRGKEASGWGQHPGGGLSKKGEKKTRGIRIAYIRTSWWHSHPSWWSAHRCVSPWRHHTSWRGGRSAGSVPSSSSTSSSVRPVSHHRTGLRCDRTQGLHHTRRRTTQTSNWTRQTARSV